MTDATGAAEETPRRRSKAPLVGALAALLLGGGGFYAAYSGLVEVPFLGPPTGASPQTADTGPDLLDPGRPQGTEAPGYVPLAPLVVALGPRAEADLLKVTLVVETPQGREPEVEAAVPRIMDVLNTFLRAVEESVLADPAEMARLRAQMLRRVRLVTPSGAVRDVLIQEFVLT